VPFNLTLPKSHQAHWKVKIHDRERSEPPHVTIYHKQQQWRLGLRDGKFLVPLGGSQKEIASEVWHTIEDEWQLLCDEWDNRYPSNLIEGDDDE